MKLSEQWLRDYVDPPFGTEKLAEQLTMAGFEVEAIAPAAPDFDNVVVGRIEDISPHADADRLRICRVNTGDSSVSVVTGAANAAPGKCFPLARVGAVLPGGLSIAETGFRGIRSAGMLCSGHELGLSADSDSLFELDPDATPGTTLVEHLRLDDRVLELSLTPNRGDCLSVAGMARELGVLNNLPVNFPAPMQTEVTTQQVRQVTLEAVSACPRYAGRVISGIDVSRKTPDWVLERLRRAAVRSINIVVDLANYVMLETGQPMHAFDNDKLEGEIVVRFSRPGEELTLLDAQHCKLQENTLLVCDGRGAVAMAGIIGGLDSAVAATTKELFLESAYFKPEIIAGRARHYGLHTDASHRYERGVDFELQEPALERLSQLILTWCGGSAGPLRLVEARAELPARPPVTLQLANIPRLLGVDIETPQVRRILQQLGLTVVEAGATLEVGVPSFRFDITIEADLIEELARVHGYDNIPSAPPLAGLRMFGASSSDPLLALQQCLVNRGYQEIISYSFVDREQQEAILGETGALALLNPISSDLGVMRSSLLPGLLGALSYNRKRQHERIRLFECGKVFRQGDELRQDPMIAGIITGKVNYIQWDTSKTSSDLYDIKSDVEALIRSGVGDRQAIYRAARHPALHPGQAAEIFIENQSIGFCGALHPRLTKAYNLAQAVFVFELELSRISTKEKVKFAKISKYPYVRRDISILLGQDIPLASVLDCIQGVATGLLNNLELFDLYQGEGIDLEKKSLALGLTFQKSSSTLTEEEVESVMGRILAALNSELGATLRE